MDNLSKTTAKGKVLSIIYTSIEKKGYTLNGMLGTESLPNFGLLFYYN